MKRLTAVSLLVACAVWVSNAGAIAIAPDASYNYTVTGPLTTFTNWALTGGATSYSFTTTSEYNSQWDYTNYISGTTAANSWVTLDLPFTSTAPLVTAKLDFSSVVADYGSNWGAAQIFVTDANNIQTKIFSQCANSTDPNLQNYNYSGTTPAAGFFKGSTDFSALVVGQSSFTLRFTAGTGWNWPMGNGGGFFPYDSRSPGNYQDFVLYGMAPEPSALVVLLGGLAGFSIRRRK